MQSRWWQAALLTLVLGPTAWGVVTPAVSSATPAAARLEFVQKCAKEMETAVAANNTTAAARARKDALLPLDPATAPSTAFIGDYSKELVATFSATALNPKAPTALMLNAAIIVCHPQLDFLSNDAVLNAALQSANPGVRYLAAKGLIADLPLLAVQLPVSLIGQQGRRKGLYPLIQETLAKEPSALVVGELHEALIRAIIETKGNGLQLPLNILTASLVKHATAWKTNPPTGEDLLSGTQSLNALADMESAANKVPLSTPQKNDALTATMAYMSYAIQWNQQRSSDPTNDPVDPTVYRLVVAGQKVVENITGVTLKSISPVQKAAEVMLTTNLEIGADAERYADKFKGVTPPQSIAGGEEK